MSQTSFKGELGDLCRMSTNGKFPVPEVILAGTLGGSLLELQELGGNLQAMLGNAGKIAFDCTGKEGANLYFGCRLRSYSLPSMKSEFSKNSKKWVALSCSPEETERAFANQEQLLKSVFLARDLTFLPSNILTPQKFAKMCRELEALGLKIDVLDKNALEKKGFEALLAVGKGSANPPFVVTLRWEGSEENPIAFVGKGVCFDSGGINIKTEHLLEMKWDKAGAAAVVGLLAMLARTNAPVHAIGIIGLVENMPDGGAMKPGDVIKTKSGLTVEVVDTDNEGRLVLADCLSYAQEIANPSIVIDLGTLTLETFGALGGEYAGLFCNDEELSLDLRKAGELSGERLWPLPMGSAFSRQLETDVADIKNCGLLGFGECGAAAEFLRRFIKPGVKWAHLDIAGVAWTQEDCPLNRKGVTGFGVRLLYEWIKSQ
jgi:leucyl aminopeptidase